MDHRGNIILPSDYARAVAVAGAVPVILPVWQALPEDLLALCDGLILAGGSDVDPARYGGDDHPAVYDIDRVRDDIEIAMVHLALQRKTPILAICRGAQVVNVALGGTLYAHLPDLPGSDLPHRDESNRRVTHAVHIDPTARLAGIMGTSAEPPISWHHQAIDRLAPGLRVAAVAPDGCIEAVEHPDHPELIAVQWRPELNAASDPAQQRLFDALTEACRARLRPTP